MASHQGAANPGNELSLKDVLYIPSLQCNLISIAKLCKDMRCPVTFSNDACVLQDCTSRIQIGAGEQHGRVYYKQGSLGEM